MLKGEYGQLPGKVNPEVRAKANIKPEDVITCRPADLLEPELPKYREEFKDIAKSDEDILSLALFPAVAPKFLERRDHPERFVEEAKPAAPAAPAPAAAPAPTAPAAPAEPAQPALMLSYPRNIEPACGRGADYIPVSHDIYVEVNGDVMSVIEV